MAGNKVTVTLAVDDQGTPVVKSFAGETTSSMSQIESASGQATSGIVAGWGTAVKALGVAVGAIYSLREAWELAELGAKASMQADAFERLAASAGSSGQQLLSEMQQVTQGMVSNFDLIGTANKAMLLGLQPTTIVQMLRIAKAASKATGDSITKSFDDMATGVARQSKMILDNLGIVIKLEDAYANYAKELNKSVKELTEVEKKQAFVNEALKQGEEIVKRVGDEYATLNRALEGAKATWENFKVGVGKILDGLLLLILDIGYAIASGMSQMAAGFMDNIMVVVNEFATFISDIPFIGRPLLDWLNNLEIRSEETADRMTKKFWEYSKAIGQLMGLFKDPIPAPKIEKKDDDDGLAAKLEAQRKALLAQYKNQQESYEAIREHLLRVRELYAKSVDDQVALSEIQKEKDEAAARKNFEDLLNRHVQMKGAQKILHAELEIIEQEHQARLTAIKQQEIAKQTELIRQSLEARMANEEAWYNTLRETDNQWNQSQLNSWATDLEKRSQYYQQRLEAFKQTAQDEAEVERATNEYKKAMLKEGAMATAQTLQDTLYYWSAHSKNVWRMYKAYAIARALVDTYQATIAAFRAMAGIPPAPLWGVLAGAAALAWGLTRVQMIRKQEQPSAAGGGIYTGPTAGYPATLHGTEAVVPLPNGRSIPVEGGGMGGGNLSVNITATDSQSFTDLVARNPQAIMGPIVEQLQLGNRNLISTMQNTTREE